MYSNGDHATVSRLVFKMQLSDIAEFDRKIAHNSTLDVDACRALYRGIRQQIARNFKKVTEQSSRRVCSYCRIKSDQYDEEVAFVLITKELIAFQVSVESGDEEESMKNDTAKNAKVKDKESSRKVDHCRTSRIENKTKSGEMFETKSKDERMNKANEKCLAEVAGGKQSCKVKRSDDIDKDKIKIDHMQGKVQEKMKNNTDAKDQSEDANNGNGRKKEKQEVHGCEKFHEKKKEEGHDRERKSDSGKEKVNEKVHKIGSLKDIEEQKKTSHVKDNEEKKLMKEKKLNQVKEKGSDKFHVHIEKESSKIVESKTNDGSVLLRKTIMKELEEDTTRANRLGDRSEFTITNGELTGHGHVGTVEVTKQSVCEHVYSSRPLGLPTVSTSNIAENIVQKEVSLSSIIGQECETVKVQSLYVWDENVHLISNVNKSEAEMIATHKTELSRIKEYLTSRIDPRTTLRRYPAANDIPLLSPEVPTPFSVTSQLVDFFVPVSREDSFDGYASGRTTKPGRRFFNGNRDHSSTQIPEVFKIKSDEKIIGSASSIVFLGPFDPNVIRHDEYVRRRITAVLDSTPLDMGDVCCVTDVGHDVHLTRITDVFGTARLLPGTSIRALTGVDPQFNPVTVVLLLISASLV